MKERMKIMNNKHISNYEFIEILEDDIELRGKFDLCSETANISKEQLTGLISVMCFQMSKYLDNEIIENHFYNDVINHLSGCFRI